MKYLTYICHDTTTTNYPGREDTGDKTASQPVRCLLGSYRFQMKNA